MKSMANASDPVGSSMRAWTKSPALVLSVAGMVVVAGLLVALVLLTPTSVAHTVTFTETGLPAGTDWSVKFNQTTGSSLTQGPTDTISFSAKDGRYNFTVAQVLGFNPTPGTGWVTVNGHDVPVNISFGPSEIPIGTAFSAGNPVLAQCPAGYSFADEGCNAGDYTYSLAIEYSTVLFGSVLFTVKTAAGGNYSVLPSSGGFSVLSPSGHVTAQTNSTEMGNELWMNTNWQTYASGVSPSSPLNSLDSILIDVGTADPAGLGLAFVVYGDGGYAGSTSPISLP